MIPAGIIAMWSGNLGNIPAGWVLCNGAFGTPDLRNYFVVGAGNIYGPGDVGGSKWHNHDFTGDTHRHDIISGDDIQAGSGYSNNTDFKAIVGTTDDAETLPPYHALAYIMKT